MDTQRVKGALVRLGLLSPLLFLCSNAAQAALLHTIVVVNAGGVVPNQVQQVGTGQAEASLGGANGTAFASFGSLKVFGLANGLGDFSGSSARDAESSASFSDSVTISGAGIALGTPGTMTVVAAIFGSMSIGGTCDVPLGGTAGCFAAWSLGLANGGTGSIDLHGNLDNIHGSNGTFGKSSATFSFFFGVPFNLTGVLNGSAFDDGINAGSISLDLGHSAYWGGISNVKANGVPVSFTLTSDSGTDWTKSFIPDTDPVPEPGTGTLVALFFGGIWLARRSQLVR